MNVGKVFFDTNVLLYVQLCGSGKAGAVATPAGAGAYRGATGFALGRCGPVAYPAAMDIEERRQISFWDALIVAAAESGGCELLYTEDLNAGQRYGAVLVRNPFRPLDAVSTN